jgi:hypothetical protein
MSFKTHQRGRGGVLRSQSPEMRGFPLCRLRNALDVTLAEILERLSPPRRDCSSPRVVKRVHAHAYWAKRRSDTTTLHLTPPQIHILAVV